MNILVFSDSHGRILDLLNIVEMYSPDAVIHLGDYHDDAQDLMRSYPNISVYAVRGNNDYGSNAPLFSVICLEGVKIYLTHGHMEGVAFTSYGNVCNKARQHGCTLALYGHTHCAYEGEDDGIKVYNSGSISLPRQGVASCLLLNLKDGNIINSTFLNADGEPISISPQKNKSIFRWF